MKNSKAVSSLAAQKQFAEPSKFAISREMQRSLLSDRGNLWSFAMAIFFTLAQLGLIVLYLTKLPPQIPIFYSMPWGNEVLANSMFIWLLPAIAITITVLNFFVYFAFLRGDDQNVFSNKQGFSSNRFLSRVLFVVSMVVGFTTFWGTMKIVTLLA